MKDGISGVGLRSVIDMFCKNSLKNSPSTNNAQSRTTSLLMFYSPFMQEYYPCFDRQNERERKTYIRHIDQLKKALKQIFRWCRWIFRANHIHTNSRTNREYSPVIVQKCRKLQLLFTLLTFLDSLTSSINKTELGYLVWTVLIFAFPVFEIDLNHVVLMLLQNGRDLK